MKDLVEKAKIDFDVKDVANSKVHTTVTKLLETIKLLEFNDLDQDDNLEHAKAIMRLVVKLRTRSESARKALVKPLNEKVKGLNKKHGDLEELIKAEENRLNAPIKAETDRLAELKRIEDEKEEARQRAINEAFDQIRMIGSKQMPIDTVEQCDTYIAMINDDMETAKVTFQEHTADAIEAMKDKLQELKNKKLEIVRAKQQSEELEAERQRAAELQRQLAEAQAQLAEQKKEAEPVVKEEEESPPDLVEESAAVTEVPDFDAPARPAPKTTFRAPAYDGPEQSDDETKEECFKRVFTDLATASESIMALMSYLNGLDKDFAQNDVEWLQDTIKKYEDMQNDG